MKPRLTVAVVLLSVFMRQGYSGEVREGSVEYAEGIYAVSFDALVSAPQAQVYQLMTDYDHLSLLSDSILESAVVTQLNNTRHTTRLLLHMCILFYCQKMVLIENVQTNGKDEIVATVMPDGSDFNSGMSHWTILSSGNAQTRLTLDRKLEPGFWVPPVIGPWLIRTKMLQELSILIERLEQYANDAPRG